jgi:hypothetical protein
MGDYPFNFKFRVYRFAIILILGTGYSPLSVNIGGFVSSKECWQKESYPHVCAVIFAAVYLNEVQKLFF